MLADPHMKRLLDALVAVFGDERVQAYPDDDSDIEDIVIVLEDPHVEFVIKASTIRVLTDDEDDEDDAAERREPDDRPA